MSTNIPRRAFNITASAIAVDALSRAFFPKEAYGAEPLPPTTVPKLSEIDQYVARNRPIVRFAEGFGTNTPAGTDKQTLAGATQ